MRPKVLVIGDAIDDEIVEVVFSKTCPDISAEAYEIKNRLNLLGGAANVAANISALSNYEIDVDLIGHVDTDFIDRSIQQRVNIVGDVVSQMTRKTRIVDIENGRTLLRIDRRSLIVKNDLNRTLRNYLSMGSNNLSLIVLSHYDQGSIDDDVMEILLANREKLLVDAKFTDLAFFGKNNCRTLGIKLNRSEFQRVIAKDHTPERYFDFFVVTSGDEGATIKIHRGDEKKYTIESIDVKGHKVPVVDSCGCGDTFLAGMAVSMVRMKNALESVEFGNWAAALAVQKKYTAIVTEEEILHGK